MMDFESNIIKNNFKIVYQLSDVKTELEKHHHNLFEIIWIKSGESKFFISGLEYAVKPNSIILINNLESHSTKIEKIPYERYYMLIPKEFLSGLINDPTLLSMLKNRPPSFCHVININEEIDIIDIIVKNIFDEFTRKLDYSDDIIKSYINILLVNLYRLNQDVFLTQIGNSRLCIISVIQKYIENNFLENITLKNTAYFFHIDMYYLSHIFKEVTGFGFKEYLIKCRINHAKDLLLNTMKSITEVCLNSGFSNVNNFIRTFKKYEGFSPLVFRKMINK